MKKSTFQPPHKATPWSEKWNQDLKIHNIGEVPGQVTTHVKQSLFVEKDKTIEINSHPIKVKSDAVRSESIVADSIKNPPRVVNISEIDPSRDQVKVEKQVRGGQHYHNVSTPYGNNSEDKSLSDKLQTSGINSVSSNIKKRRNGPLQKPDSSFKMFVKQQTINLKKKGITEDEASSKAVELWMKLSSDAKDKYQKKYEEKMKKYKERVEVDKRVKKGKIWDSKILKT